VRGVSACVRNRRFARKGDCGREGGGGGKEIRVVEGICRRAAQRARTNSARVGPLTGDGFSLTQQQEHGRVCTCFGHVECAEL